MTSRIAMVTAGMLTGGVLALGIYIATDEGVPTPTAPIAAQPLPRATITITPPTATVTKQLPEATKTVTRKLPRATITIRPKQLPRATKRITEDDPRWNCKTMGNHRCGKVVAPRKQYPGPCMRVPQDMRADCASLYRRAAMKQIFSDGSEAWSPAGPALVRECTDQYKGAELRECLRP